MKVVLQRVAQARVDVAGELVGRIGPGLLLLAGFAPGDEPAQVRAAAQRLLAYRIFPDEQGRMNRDVRQAGGGVLAVPNFTLEADTRRGLRPSFASAAPPAQAQPLFEEFLAALRASGLDVASGRFGADMQVQLVNDGPVTLSFAF